MRPTVAGKGTCLGCLSVIVVWLAVDGWFEVAVTGS
jgi:hypothetical protein